MVLAGTPSIGEPKVGAPSPQQPGEEVGISIEIASTSGVTLNYTINEVEIVALYPELADWQVEFKRWSADIRTRHPFARMNKADILKELRRTREIVWAEAREYGKITATTQEGPKW